MLLASTFATLAGASALPAAGGTPVNFTLTAGALSISAPAGPVALGVPQLASPTARTFTGLLGTVTVTDDRGSGAWVASVISTAFTPNNAAAAVPATAVSYAPGAITVLGVTVATPATTDLTGVSPVVNGTSTALSTASWNPTITVLVPGGSAPGIYSGTITHSVA
jgi:hypothetical protein